VSDVVHVYKDLPPVYGGIEQHVALLGRLLAERGLTVEALCTRRPGSASEEVRGGVRIRRCAAPVELASTPLPPALPWALRRSGARIVHLHLPWPPGEVAWLLGGRRRPLVVTLHCEVVRYPRLASLLEPLERRVLGAAQRIVVSSPALAELPLLTAHRDRVRVVPYGVDLEHFRPGEPSDPLPQISRPRILFVGRLRYYKGLKVLAEALARLPAAQLVVVGDGPARPVLEAALRRHGCANRAHLLGAIGDERLPALLQSADAAVLASTSRAEAFGLSLAEAQACGVPAVTTALGTGTALTLSDGASGRVVPPGDAAALAAGLAWCLDPAERAGRRAAARAHAEASLCGRRMAAAIHALYDEIAPALQGEIAGAAADRPGR
jgi:rhamnosyl/mannosyltransferase